MKLIGSDVYPAVEDARVTLRVKSVDEPARPLDFRRDEIDQPAQKAAVPKRCGTKRCSELPV